MAGSTLMAAGSSAPELAVALFAIFMAGNHEALGIGTIVGSALFNILLITGVVMYIRKSAKLIWQPILRDIIFYILSILLLVYVFIEGEITLLNAALLVGVYLIYILVVYYWKRIFPYDDIEVEIKSKAEDRGASVNWLSRKIKSFNHYFFRYQFLVFIVSIGLISILSWILVRSAVGISESLGIPELLIGLTIVAIGTSIPDLISSMIVARQGRPGMAINNAIGSNVFDILIGLGLPFLLYVLINGTGFGIASENLIFSVSILMASAVILLLFFLLGGWKSSRMVGVILILLYVTYLGHVVFISIR
jgi:K+-dependent Na+/Ca+ exchanger-like protein